MSLARHRVVHGLLVFLVLSGVYATSLALVHGRDGLRVDVFCKWDCGWYGSIIRNGYVSTIPPVAQRGDEANVAFFPLHPAVAGITERVFGIGSERAIPLTSMAFTLGFFLLAPSLLRTAR